MPAAPPRRRGLAFRHGAFLLVALTAAPAFAAPTKIRESGPALRREATLRRAPPAPPPRASSRAPSQPASRRPVPKTVAARPGVPPVIPGWRPLRGPRFEITASARGFSGRDLAPFRLGAARGRPPAPFQLALPPEAPSRAVPAVVALPTPVRPPVIEMPRAVALAELALHGRTPLAGGGTPLPEPLPPSDAARLRRIFAQHARSAFAEAAREAERLDDRRLIGHVLADRWLRRNAPEPSTAHLRAWLLDHADHPDAPRLHALLVARSPAGAPVPPPLPGAPEATETTEAELPPEERAPAAAPPLPRNPALDRTVREMVGRGDAEGALAQIGRTRGVTPAYAAALQAEAAQALFAAGRDADALRVASAAARQPGAPALAAYVAGLAAWGMGQYETALGHFESAARNEAAPAVQRSAAAFWTARAAVRSRRPQAYVPWMLQAAQEPRTFYGLLARRALGLPFGFAWEAEVAGEAETRALTETAGGWRALALLQVGQGARAEAELRRLLGAARGNASLNRAMLAVATSAGMADLATELAGAAQRADGRPRDFARYPVPPLSPRGGWRVDPALIYGVARQESNFDAAAVSPAGARGLMQVMPATAAYITGDSDLRGEAGRDRLNDPAFSLDLAQRYLVHLTTHEFIGTNLIRMLAAYNAGPGAVQRWLPANGRRDDPFLFIESIPIHETRAYVQRVLGYSFIYASRLGLPSPALDALAAGAAPRLVGIEDLARLVQRTRAGG